MSESHMHVTMCACWALIAVFVMLPKDNACGADATCTTATHLCFVPAEIHMIIKLFGSTLCMWFNKLWWTVTFGWPGKWPRLARLVCTLGTLLVANTMKRLFAFCLFCISMLCGRRQAMRIICHFVRRTPLTISYGSCSRNVSRECGLYILTGNFLCIHIRAM